MQTAQYVCWPIAHVPQYTCASCCGLWLFHPQNEEASVACVSRNSLRPHQLLRRCQSSETGPEHWQRTVIGAAVYRMVHGLDNRKKAIRKASGKHRRELIWSSRSGSWGVSATRNLKQRHRNVGPISSFTMITINKEG
jgi:hypothetical protein